MRIAILIALSSLAPMMVANCTPSTPNALDILGTADMTIKGQSFKLWIADNFDERARGLMFVTKEEMAPLSNGVKRGMIFVFDFESLLTFWMKNTIIPLDIAYLDSQGGVVAIHTMIPLDVRPGQYPSREPAQFAIEVNKSVFSDLNLQVGDRLDIPAQLLKQ